MTLEQNVFIAADKALNAVVQQIKDDQWSMRMPEWFQVGKTKSEPTLRTIINYHAYDEAWVPDVLAGKTVDESTGAPKDMDSDLLGSDPKKAFATFTEKGIAAAEALDLPSKLVHLSYGDNFTALEYLTHVSSFRGFRTYDLAKVIGIDPTLPSDLVQGMWDEFSPHFEEWRAMGVFKAALPIPEGASLQDKLLLSVGRPL